VLKRRPLYERIAPLGWFADAMIDRAHDILELRNLRFNEHIHLDATTSSLDRY
jgi:hypothetical protein